MDVYDLVTKKRFRNFPIEIRNMDDKLLGEIPEDYYAQDWHDPIVDSYRSIWIEGTTIVDNKLIVYLASWDQGKMEDTTVYKRVFIDG